MNVVLLILSVVMNLISYGIIRNEFSKKDVKNNSDLHVFNAITSLVSMVTLTVICAFTSALFLPSMYTVLLGIVFGLSTALFTILNMKALESGPLSYTNVIVSCAMVIPVLSSMVLYNETVSTWQVVGIVLMVTSFVCSVDSKNSGSGASLRWLLFSLGAFLFSGTVGVMQKVHQNSLHKDELGIFLIIAFGVSAIFSFCFMAYYKKTNNETVTVLSKKKMHKFVICSVTCGIGIALCNQINMYLAGAMAAIIFYPVVNGASMILTAAAGIILWKERLSKKQWLGLVVGGVAILLLCNIF